MSQQISTNTFGVAKWIVSPTASQGTHTTLAGAIASASAGDTIFIRPGTYTENVTLKNGVNLAGLDFRGGAGERTVIVGTMIDNGGVVNVTITNIDLKTNSTNVIILTASGSTWVLDGCLLNCTNNTGMAISTGATVKTYNSGGDLGTTGIGFSTGAGTWNDFGGNYTNSGSSLTATTTSGTISLNNSSFASCFSTSSGGAITINPGTLIDTSAINTISLTTAGTGTSNIYNSSLFSGTASTISIGSGTTVGVFSAVVKSSNTNAITGAGTINIGNITFSGTSRTINTTTQAGNYVDSGKQVATQQPGFSATLTASATNATGNAAAFTIVFDNEYFDVGNNYNNATGIFTAPVAGKYLFEFTVACATITSAMTSGIVQLVTTARTYTCITGNPFATLNVGSGAWGYSASRIVSMAASDTAKVVVTISGGAGNTAQVNGGANNLSVFSGELIA